MVTIAILQMNSDVDPAINLRVIEEAAIKAANQGAKMLFTPEMSLLVDRDRKRAEKTLDKEAEKFLLSSLVDVSRRQNIWITAGGPSLLKCGRFANRYWVFSPSKNVPVDHYDKIHMFDVDLATGEKWKESSVYKAGSRVVSVERTPIGPLGLAICYDLRFPALFSRLGSLNCNAITIPSAFTVPTGKDHWHILLRARAIEASSYVIAPAQVGKHKDGRETFGHSLVVDPWGTIILELNGSNEELGLCDVDVARINDVRSQLPSLANRRFLAE